MTNPAPRHRHPARTAAALAGALLLLGLGACGSDAGAPADTAAAAATSAPAETSAPGDSAAPADTAAPATSASATAATAAAPIDPDRCARNRAVGRITFLTGFDFAAASSIVEWIVAEERGYFDALCLDVELTSSFSSANFALVAAGKAQFASGGSYTELLRNSPEEDPLQLAYVLGRAPIEVLLVKPSSGIETLAGLSGRKIGVKGDLPPAIQVMLARAGLTRDLDYSTVTVDGFDPVQHFSLPIDALPAWRSNEPGRLERAGVPFRVFDPLDNGVPGSFGAVFTSRAWATAHPEVVADVVRAALRGLEDAMADPAAAVALAVGRIEANGNPNFLSAETEGFRWTTEARTIRDLTPEGVPVGAADAAALQAEVDAATEAGVFPVKPDTAGTWIDGLVDKVSGPDGRVAFPG